MYIWAAGWEACMYVHVCLHSLQGASAPGSPGLSLPCWCCSGPLAMPKAPSIRHPSLRSSPNPSAGCEGSPRHTVPLCRTGYAILSNSPGKPSLAGSSGSACPDLPACSPEAVKQRAGHQEQPAAPASWCCALGEHCRGGKALTI